MINMVRRFVAFIAVYKKRIALIASGQGLWTLISWAYDNPLYIWAVASLGVIVGGTMMTIGSLVICFGMIQWYNRKGVDWLGVGAVDEVRALSLSFASKLAKWEAGSLIGKILLIVFWIPIQLVLFLARLINHGFWGESIAFVLLSILRDPFTTTAYLRHGVYGPMKSKDYWIFFGSGLLSNGYWIVRTVAIIEVAKYIWRSI